MDLALDFKQSKAFDCSSCDSGMQRLRNCGGQYKKSGVPMIVNENLYRQCPRSLAFGKERQQYLVSMFFDCRETKSYPAEGSYLTQTAYTKELFDFLDGMVSDHKSRDHEKQMREMNKNSK